MIAITESVIQSILSHCKGPDPLAKSEMTTILARELEAMRKTSQAVNDYHTTNALIQKEHQEKIAKLDKELGDVRKACKHIIKKRHPRTPESDEYTECAVCGKFGV